MLKGGEKTAYQCTFVGMDLEIELGKEQLAEVEQADVHITTAETELQQN